MWDARPSMIWWHTDRHGDHSIMDKETKARLIKDYQRSENDVGSCEVQVALTTERINELTEHMKIHKKDFTPAVVWSLWSIAAAGCCLI